MSFLGLITKKEYEQKVLAIKAELLANLPSWLYQTADAEKFNIPDPSIYGNQADLYRKLSWVLQAVDITASAGALSRFDVKRIISNKEPKDIPNHPFELLLMSPNPLDSRYEFLYGTIAMFMLTGNAYWFLNKADEYSEPDELWLIPSHMIQPVPDEKMYIQGYYYYPGNGREILLDPWKICHFRRFNPFSRFVGLSAIESIAVIAQGDMGMQEWNTKFFKENNARLPGILTFEQMVADSTWQKIKDDTRDASKKRELLMLRGVGQGGVNWLQNAVSQKEMEFLSGRLANRDEIWNTLAPGLVSMLSDSATEANARNGAAVFNERTIYPKHVLMAEKITNQILPCYSGRQLLGCFEDIRITDKQMEMDEQKLYNETHTIGEIREEYYGDAPLGDERDALLLSQLNATSGGVQNPSPLMPPLTNKPIQERGSAENEMPEEPEEDESYKAVIDDLRKWERKAIKHIGKSFEFTSDLIPDEIVRYVSKRLSSCTSVTSIKAVFDAARTDASPKPKEAELVLKGLIEVLRAKQ